MLNQITLPQQKKAAKTLGEAFANDTFMSYMLPNSQSRVSKLIQLFIPAIKFCIHYGGIEIREQGGGILLWVSGKSLSFNLIQLIKSGLIWLPLTIGIPAFKRFYQHDRTCEHALNKHTSPNFAYLWVLGVHPDCAGRGLAKQMVTSALNKMREEGYSTCILRTENPKNVGFYEHLGFKQIYTDIPASSGIRFWLFEQAL